MLCPPHLLPDFNGGGRQGHPRQIQLAFEGLLAQGTVKGFKVGEAVLVAGFEGLDSFDDGRERLLIFVRYVNRVDWIDSRT